MCIENQTLCPYPKKNKFHTRFLDASAHLDKRSCPSVGPSVRRSVPRYFRTTNMAVFEGKKSSNDIINNDTISDDEVVASYVPPRYLFSISCERIQSRAIVGSNQCHLFKWSIEMSTVHTPLSVI